MSYVPEWLRPGLRHRQPATAAATAEQAGPAEGEILRPPLTARLRPWHWVAIDSVVAALFVLAYGVGPRHPEIPVYGFSLLAGRVLAGLTCLAVAVRRLWPRTVFAVVVVGWAFAGVVTIAISPLDRGPAFPVAFVMYMVALRVERRSAVTALAGALVVLGAAIFAGTPALHLSGGISHDVSYATGVILANSVVITAAWAMGAAVRQQRAYAAGLREQAERRAAEKVAEAGRAVAEERLRIARELHDVVAHSMSLIAVRAGVANYVVTQRPEEAASALSSIVETSRSALQEMRRLLGVLREDPEDHGTGLLAQLNPAPGLRDLDQLVSRTADAGVRVDLLIHGDCRPLPAGVDLAAYRVIQEALTNVIKHAGTDATRVVVTYADDALLLEITDHGRGGGAADGHGIVGMRERVALYEGDFRAGPLPGRGFGVTATLPLGDGLPTVQGRTT